MKNAKYQKINLNNNTNTSIKGNLIGNFSNNIIIQNNFDIDKISIDWTLRESMKFNELLENKLLITNAIQRTVILNEKIEKIIKYSNLYGYKPICRLYGCFTTFSTIQQKSDKSDLAQLELYEKDNIISFVKNDFLVKVIISLDTNMIFSNNAYTKEQYIERCIDLVQTIKSLNKYENLQIVFDKRNTLDSIYIIDTLLTAKSYNALLDETIQNYSVTLFDSDKHIIETEINTFDKKFNNLLVENQILKNFYHVDTVVELFETIYESRMESWFKE